MSTIDWTAADRADLARVAAEVRRWADAASDSPLYRTFALGIAQDPELLRVGHAFDTAATVAIAQAHGRWIDRA